jgi:hypothetical protein
MTTKIRHTDAPLGKLEAGQAPDSRTALQESCSVSLQVSKILECRRSMKRYLDAQGRRDYVSREGIRVAPALDLLATLV